MTLPILIKTEIYNDSRGFFKELWLKKKIKFNCKFTAMSFSKRNVIRGLHIQTKKSQGKFISVLKGRMNVMLSILSKNKYFAINFS